MSKSVLLLIPVVLFITGCQTAPSHNAVAFSQLTEGYWQIWTMQPDGTNKKQMTVSSSDKRYPVWYPDSNAVFFRTNNNEVFKIDFDTNKEERVLESVRLNGGIVPSPDGRWLLSVRFNQQLRDSSKLLLTDRTGENGRVLTTDAGLQYDPSWSPDGKMIAYINSHGYRTNELYIIGANGQDKCKLTDNNAIELLPAFSPDGKIIAYVSDISGNYEIWLMNTDGSNWTKLTDSKGIDTRPCWSPDGKEIMFTSKRSGILQIWIMNSDGNNPRQLTDGSPSMDPAWRKK